MYVITRTQTSQTAQTRSAEGPRGDRRSALGGSGHCGADSRQATVSRSVRPLTTDASRRLQRGKMHLPTHPVLYVLHEMAIVSLFTKCIRVDASCLLAQLWIKSMPLLPYPHTRNPADGT